jgi:hypothetical protein
MGSPGPFRLVAPDRLQIKEGGGCLSLFGLPFLLAGIFVVLIGVRIVPMSNAADVPAWAWPLIFLMGLVFVVVGGGLVLGRGWITLDAGRGTLRREWGLLVPLRGKEQRVDGYDAVLLRFAAGDSDSADRYPVLLRARSGGTDYALSSSTQYGESRERAAAVAKILNLPLVDASTDHESIRNPDRVDATLQERLCSGEDASAEAARPLRMQCQVRESSRAVEIALPGPGFKPSTLIGPVISIAILGYLAPGLLEFFQRTRTPETVQIVFFAVATLILVVFPLMGVVNAVVLAKRGGSLVTASPEGIVIEERSAWRVKTTRVLAADILALDYGTADTAFRSARRGAEDRLAQAGQRIPSLPGPGREVPRWLGLLRRLTTSKGIIVKSRKGLLSFGAGLPDDEVRYLHGAVARALGASNDHRW